MKVRFEVIAGNIGYVYIGGDANSANDIFDLYVQKSKDGVGSVAGESVTLIVDGEISREHEGLD